MSIPLAAAVGTLLADGGSALADTAGKANTLGLFVSEFFGTFILILLGAGVCAAVNLPKSYAKNAGWVVITFGWGLAVFTAVYLSFPSGAHLNPAVTLGLASAGRDLEGSDPPSDPRRQVLDRPAARSSIARPRVGAPGPGWGPGPRQDPVGGPAPYLVGVRPRVR